MYATERISARARLKCCVPGSAPKNQLKHLAASGGGGGGLTVVATAAAVAASGRKINLPTTAGGRWSRERK